MNSKIASSRLTRSTSKFLSRRLRTQKVITSLRSVKIVSALIATKEDFKPPSGLKRRH